MKSNTIEGKELLLQHNNIKQTLIENYRNKPEVLAEEIQRLTYITLSRFRALMQFPFYDHGEDYK